MIVREKQVRGRPFQTGHPGWNRVPYRASYSDIKDTEWAYLAGLIDGEGSFYVCYDRRNDVYSLEVAIANTARSMIEWLLEHFGGTEKLSGTPKHEGCPSQWAWVVRGRRAAPIIAGILPYLVVKVGQARLAEAFLATYDVPIRPRPRMVGRAVLATLTVSGRD